MNGKRSIALAVLLLCAFAVTVDTTIVNVTLPTLSTALDASTRELQWIVDAYTLVFSALLLAAGHIGDRFGRRLALQAGLLVFAATSVLAALTTSTAQLIGARALMGVGAALVFPATLAIIVAVFFWGSALQGILGMILAIPLTGFLVVFWRLAREKYIGELV